MSDATKSDQQSAVNCLSLNGAYSYLKSGSVSENVVTANPNLGCAINGLTSLSVPIGQTTFL